MFFASIAVSPAAIKLAFTVIVPPFATIAFPPSIGAPLSHLLAAPTKESVIFKVLFSFTIMALSPATIFDLFIKLTVPPFITRALPPFISEYSYFTCPTISTTSKLTVPPFTSIKVLSALILIEPVNFL